MTTYDRKYYLIRRIKAAGFEFSKKSNERIILVPPNKVRQATTNKYVNELKREHQYSVQTTIAL